MLRISLLRPLYPLAMCVLLVLSLSACRRAAEPAVEIRGVTREMVLAARQAAGGAAEIGMRPQAGPRNGSPGMQTPAAPAAPPPDHIYITLRDPARRAAVEGALDAVARRHRLVRRAASTPQPAPGLSWFAYAAGGRQTHAVLIAVPGGRRPAPQPGGGPMLALVMDDIGYDRAAAHALFALPYPFTVAVLPHLPSSTDLAEEAHRLGLEVMLHLPMQALNGEVPGEPYELRPGMSGEEVRLLIGRMLDSVPHAAGANNHQGSRATRDRPLMDEVMRALAGYGLFFLDSRTAGGSVAYDAARRAGLSAAYRTVFLDDTPTREFALGQLQIAERQAREQGWAIAIGHPHPATLEALSEYLPQLEARGVRLVFVSHLVKK